MFRPDRNRRAGRFLEWKVRIFAAGAVLAMVGMYFEERWMTGLAIVVLVGGLVVRLVLDRKPDAGAQEAFVADEPHEADEAAGAPGVGGPAEPGASAEEPRD